jgi:hypothetical protein
LINDHSLATPEAEKKRDALVRALQAEFKGLKKKVTLDEYFDTKARIRVF